MRPVVYQNHATQRIGNRYHPAGRPPLMGFHQDLGFFGDDSFWEPRMTRTRRISSQVTRGQLLWEVVEPSNGTFSWTRYDNLIRICHQRGMLPIFSLTRSPQWANGNADPYVIPGTGTDATFTAFADNYADFAGRVAGRYRGLGVCWEIWNEPNEQFFWKPVQNQSQYNMLFSKARTAMLQADPMAKVGVGGITGLNAGGGIKGTLFLENMIAAGIQFDYVGIHPYISGLTRSPDSHTNFEDNFDDIALINTTLRNAGRANVKLWTTEWGWYGGSPDDATKGTYIQRGHERILGEWGGFVEASSYFMDQATPDYPDAGVYDQAGTAKGSATNFQNFQAAH